MTKIIKHVFISGLILVCCFNYVTAYQNDMFTNKGRPPSTNDPDAMIKPKCYEGGPVAVMFRELSFSKYLVWVAAALLLAGILQILIGLFVFLSDALDIYMLLLNYCIATLFCICTILISGGGTFEPLENTCKYLSPLSSIAISVPMMTLFLLSYSRFYAITYPFYYVDKFTVINQLIVCFLSWFIPIIVVGLGTAFLCTSISVHTEQVLTGFCVYPSQPVYAASHIWYNQRNSDGEWGWGNSYGGYMDGNIPADSGCQIYMIIYVLICLILPLSGCIVCYSCIVYQLTIIKKNREKITNSSTGGANPADQFVTVNESESVPKVRSMKSKTFSVASLKQHLKKQTSNISQKAKERVPVSVILILTLYIFVAVPLTIVEVFNTSLVGGDTSAAKLVWKNLDEEKLFSLREEQKKYIWCDDKIKDTPSFTQDWVTTFLDIGYSVGLLALGLSPWAYIKFTKSFEENLWLRPLKKISGKIGLEISKSVRSKYTGPGHGKPVPKSNPKVSAANGSTSGYSTGLSAGAPPSARHAPPSPRPSPRNRPVTPQPPGRAIASTGAPPPSPRASPRPSRASPNVGKNPPDPVAVEATPLRQSLTAPNVDPATGRHRRRCRSRNPSAETPTTDQTVDGDAAPDNNNNV